jgi:WD40 repeat protein
MAKINGQLERSQFENIVGTPAGSPGIRGRIWADITDPANAVPKFDTGSAVKQLAFTTTTVAILTVNSGKAVTIDWSQGLTQILQLTDNCVVSFSNPQAEQVHTLIVRQLGWNSASVNTTYMYTLNMSDQEAAGSNYQPFGAILTSRTRTHKWLYKSAIALGYSATVPFASLNPRNLPATLATGIDIAPDGTKILMGRTSTPFLSAYSAGRGPLGSYSPFADAYAAPTAIVAQANGVKFTPDGKMVFISSATTPFIQGWATPLGTPIASSSLANPGTLPTGAGQCVDVHPSGMFAGVGHTTTPFMSIYPTDTQAFGTKLANPVALPSAQVNAIAFSPTGDFVAAATQTTPFIHVWAFAGANTGAGAIGALCANPGALPTGGPAGGLGKGIAWRPQGDYIAMASTTGPFLYVVAFNRATASFGATLAMTTPPGAATTCVQWSADGNFLIVGGGTSGFLYVYDFSASTIGVPLVVTGAAPAVQVNDIAVDPNNTYFLLALNASPFTTGYVMPTKDRNYLKLLE